MIASGNKLSDGNVMMTINKYSQYYQLTMVVITNTIRYTTYIITQIEKEIIVIMPTAAPLLMSKQCVY